MREAQGGTWLFGIVILFVLLFSGYLAISMNMARAHTVKSNTLMILEKHNGLTPAALRELQDYLDRVGYRNRQSCPSRVEIGMGRYVNWYGFRNGTISPATGQYYLCILYIPTGATGEEVTSGYFRIRVSFHLDLPIFGEWFDMAITGETRTLFNPACPRGRC